jgi:DGQHR domain-containing protein
MALRVLRRPGQIAKQTARSLEESEELNLLDTGEFVSFTASLISQGKHRFYTLSMPSDILATTCVVDTRSENPIEGFQRLLDVKRAQEIADYVDTGFGTIPTSIVLSAQADAQLHYTTTKRTLRFRKIKGAFLILDGQHRVYGFFLATTRLRVPVVIYNNLSRAEECRLFMDINTKQRPVPSELLLDIKRLAETETDAEALLKDVFDLFQSESDSPLFGLLSPAERKKGRISRVTFNAALKAIWEALVGSDANEIYHALSAYMHACLSGLRTRKAQDKITNPTLFRALLQLFPVVAERVSDRHGQEYTTANFSEIVGPFIARLKKSDLDRPGTSYIVLFDNFRKALRSGFSIGSGTST